MNARHLSRTLPDTSAQATSSWLVPGATKDGQTVTADWLPTPRERIHGLVVHEVKHVVKSNGVLTEVFRRDWHTDSLPVDQVFQVVLQPGAISAWHAHEHATDRLFVSQGLMRVVFYDARPESPTRGCLNEFRLGTPRPALIVVPPKVWHGVQNLSHESGTILNLVDRAYCYEDPDHWRVPHDSPHIDFAWPDARA